MNHVITAGGIVRNGNKILLVKKQGKYVIPKGHLENNETLEQAALREVQEETGCAAIITGYHGSLTRVSTENSGEVVQKKIEVFKMSLLAATGMQLDESEWVQTSTAPEHMLYPEESDFLRHHFAALFRSKTFTVAGSDKIACLISGYRGSIRGYAKPIEYLISQGYTVVAYEHSSTVLTKGNPQDLIDLVDGMYQDFSGKMAGYKKIICLGASVGAGIGFSLQRRIPRIAYGVYAVAGVSPSANIFEAPLFYFVRKTFKKKGYDAKKLQDIWQEHEILPNKPLAKGTKIVVTLGQQDKIVTYTKALSTLHAWQTAGTQIKIITKPRLGHIATIKWFKNHLGELMAEAESLR